MPRIPKNRRRPWIAKAKKYAKDYGNEDSSWYRSKEWRKLRLMILQNEPLCRECSAVAEMVDHIRPIKEGGARLDPENLQPLCHSCHNRKRAQEGNRRRWEE
jgi:5-methylcytosine-specific restriction protein A